MALDFPNSPTVGQIFTASNGTSWQWTGTVWVAAGTATGLITGAPNKLINPFMEIDQANEGTAVTGGGYIVDGLSVGIASGPALTCHRSTDAPPGYPASVFVQTTSSVALVAGTTVDLNIPIEAADLADTAFGTASARTLSLAFWAKASLAGTYAVALRNAAATRSVCFNYTLAAATWQLVAQIIPGDTAGAWVAAGNAAGAYLTFSPVTGSNYQTATPGVWASGNFKSGTGISNAMATTIGSSFQIGPAGLWVAPAAQPLLRTSPSAELARCQRYFEKSYAPGTKPGTSVGSSGNSNAIMYAAQPGAVGLGGMATYAVPKRAAPTVTSYTYAGGVGVSVLISGAWTTSTAQSLTTTQPYGHSIVLNTANLSLIAWDWVADARL